MSSSQKTSTTGPQANRPWAPRPSERNPNWRKPYAPSGRNSPSPGERRSESLTASPGSSNQTSPLPSPPAKDSNTTTVESRQSTPPTHVQQDYTVAPGIILFFPRGFKTGNESESSLLREQPWVNKAATNHFVLVWDTYEAEGELIARCMPMTSFGGIRIEDKYNRGAQSWRHHVRYVPIAQHGCSIVSDTEMPSLNLYQHEAMDHQTYVHLDHFFEIEAKYLQCSKPLYLMNASLDVLMYKFWQFISGETARATPETAPKSGMDYGRIPVLSPEQLALVERGHVHEDGRHEYAGTSEWTGREARGPRRKMGAQPRPDRKF